MANAAVAVDVAVLDGGDEASPGGVQREIRRELDEKQPHTTSMDSTLGPLQEDAPEEEILLRRVEGEVGVATIEQGPHLTMHTSDGFAAGWRTRAGRRDKRKESSPAPSTTTTLLLFLLKG